MPANALQKFEFENQTVRTIVGKDGEPWFVAADVCKVLDIANVGNVLPAIRKTGQYSMKEMTPLQQLRAHLEILERQEAQLAEHEDRLRRLETKQIAAENGVQYFSVIAYCRYKKLPAPSLNEANQIGRQAAALSRQRGLSIGKTADGRFGFVNTYHESILEAVINHL